MKLGGAISMAFLRVVTFSKHWFLIQEVPKTSEKEPVSTLAVAQSEAWVAINNIINIYLNIYTICLPLHSFQSLVSRQGAFKFLKY